ncbi:MAG: ABC transporter ATP-binding protein, partial [Ktedonobacterales bacterium]
LDAITRGRLQDELRRLQQAVHKTILFVTHDVEEAFKLGEQIVVMSEGKLMQEGSLVELLAKPANDFVRQLVGADNILRQFEYLPVTQALQPVADSVAGERISAGTTLLRALLHMIEVGSSVLLVERDGKVVGQVSLTSISRQVQQEQQRASADENADVSRPASAASAAH